MPLRGNVHIILHSEADAVLTANNTLGGTERRLSREFVGTGSGIPESWMERGGAPPAGCGYVESVRKRTRRGLGRGVTRQIEGTEGGTRPAAPSRVEQEEAESVQASAAVERGEGESVRKRERREAMGRLHNGEEEAQGVSEMSQQSVSSLEVDVVDEYSPSATEPEQKRARRRCGRETGQGREAEAVSADDRGLAEVEVVDVDEAEQDDVAFVLEVCDAEAALPLPQFEAEPVNERPADVFQNTMCPICWRRFRTSGPVVEGVKEGEWQPPSVQLLVDAATAMDDDDDEFATDMQVTRCGHFFCGSCLEKAVGRKRVPCPRCRAPLSRKDFFKCFP